MIMESRESGGISIRSFYVRRVFRIVPLYLLAFLATAGTAAVLAGFLGDHSKVYELASTWPWALTFNRELCPEQVCGATFFGHAWTIGIEEKFYIFWPIIFAISLLYSRAALFVVMALVAIIISSFMQSEMVRGYIGILFGCYAALFYARRNRQFGSIFLWLPAFVFGYILSTWHEIWYGNLVISFSASWVIVYLMDRPEGMASRILGAKPLAWLGKLTYGIYLFHLLAINLVSLTLDKLKFHGPQQWLVVACLSYLLSIATAFFLHKTVEQPMIRLGKALARSE